MADRLRRTLDPALAKEDFHLQELSLTERGRQALANEADASACATAGWEALISPPRAEVALGRSGSASRRGARLERDDFLRIAISGATAIRLLSRRV
jgi:hypothetical protein